MFIVRFLIIVLFPAFAFADQDCSKAAKLLSSANVLGSRADDNSSEMLNEAYTLCPSSVEVAYAYGNSLAKKGALDEALEVFSKNDDPVMNISKASILAETGKFDEGSEILEKVLGENPRKVEALQALASLEYKRNNFKESERLIRLAIQEKTEDFSLFYNLGITLEKLKRYDEAKLSLLSSLRLNSNNAEALSALARVYLIKGNTIEAKDSADKAVTIAPESSLSWFTQGLVNQQQGKHDEALKSLTKANELNANDLKINLAMLVSEIYTGKKEAINKLVELKQKNPDDIDITKSLLWAYLYLKDYKSAQKDIEQFKSKVENDAIALNNLGVLHNKLGNTSEAQSSFKKALELNPGLKQAQVNLNLIEDK